VPLDVKVVATPMNAESEALALTEREGAVRFGARVRPRASRTAVAGVREGQLVVGVTAPPVEGEANAELVRAIAALAGVPRHQVTIVAGQTGRSKLLEVKGLGADELRRRLSGGPRGAR
jgi:uncharacterized protein